VVTRSSAVSEDAAGSSMAGRFHSVLDVRGWPRFLAALDEVAASARVIALDGSHNVELHEMAILVQRFLPAAYGGVLFGADPVSGRADRFSLATVRGGPDALVSGIDGGSQQLLTRHGRVTRSDGDTSAAPPWRRRRELAALARRAAAAGHPGSCGLLGTHLPGGTQGDEGPLSAPSLAGGSVERSAHPPRHAAPPLANRR